MINTLTIRHQLTITSAIKMLLNTCKKISKYTIYYKILDDTEC